MEHKNNNINVLKLYKVDEKIFSESDLNIIIQTKYLALKGITLIHQTFSKSFCSNIEVEMSAKLYRNYHQKNEIFAIKKLTGNKEITKHKFMKLLSKSKENETPIYEELIVKYPCNENNIEKTIIIIEKKNTKMRAKIEFENFDILNNFVNPQWLVEYSYEEKEKPLECWKI